MVWRRNSSASLGSDFNSACGVVGEGEFVDDELELSDGGGVDMVAGDKKVLLYDAPLLRSLWVRRLVYRTTFLFFSFQ